MYQSCHDHDHKVQDWKFNVELPRQSLYFPEFSCFILFLPEVEEGENYALSYTAIASPNLKIIAKLTEKCSMLGGQTLELEIVAPSQLCLSFLLLKIFLRLRMDWWDKTDDKSRKLFNHYIKNVIGLLHQDDRIGAETVGFLLMLIE